MSPHSVERDPGSDGHRQNLRVGQVAAEQWGLDHEMLLSEWNGCCLHRVMNGRECYLSDRAYRICPVYGPSHDPISGIGKILDHVYIFSEIGERIRMGKVAFVSFPYEKFADVEEAAYVYGEGHGWTVRFGERGGPDDFYMGGNRGVTPIIMEASGRYVHSGYLRRLVQQGGGDCIACQKAMPLFRIPHPNRTNRRWP